MRISTGQKGDAQVTLVLQIVGLLLNLLEEIIPAPLQDLPERSKDAHPHCGVGFVIAVALTCCCC